MCHQVALCLREVQRGPGMGRRDRREHARTQPVGVPAVVDTVAQPGLALQHQAQGEVGGGLVVQFGRVQVHVLEAQRRANGRRIECCDGVHAGVTCSSRAAAARSTRS